MFTGFVEDDLVGPSAGSGLALNPRHLQLGGDIAAIPQLGWSQLPGRRQVAARRKGSWWGGSTAVPVGTESNTVNLLTQIYEISSQNQEQNSQAAI